MATRPVRTTISQRELRNDSGAVMRRVSGGESFVVTTNGTPVADLVPHVPSDGPRRWVPTTEIAQGLAALPDWGVDGFRAELAELDGGVDDEVTDPWPR